MSLLRNIQLNIKRDITEEEARLIAWVFALEGAFMILKGKRGYTPRITVTNTSTELLAALKRILGGCVGSHGRRRPRCRKAYRLTICGRVDIAYLIERILPYLPYKRDRAELLRKWCLKPDEATYKELRRLNRRGFVIEPVDVLMLALRW